MSEYVFKYKTVDGNALTDNAWISENATGEQYQEDGWWCVPLEDSVTSIGMYAFSDYTGLTKITIPESVTSIGYMSFAGCTGLTEITIPDSVTTIDACVFWGCTELTEITIPNTITSISRTLFGDCTGLTEITIPDSVITIDYGAFGGCTNLASFTCEASVPPEINDASSFVNTPADKILYVPKEYVSAYQSSGWANYFGTIVQIPDPEPPVPPVPPAPHCGFNLSGMKDTNFVKQGLIRR